VLLRINPQLCTVYVTIKKFFSPSVSFEVGILKTPNFLASVSPGASDWEWESESARLHTQLIRKQLTAPGAFVKDL